MSIIGCAILLISICSPGHTLSQSQLLDSGGNQSKNSLQVYIETPNNETKLILGSSISIKCRFSISRDQDIKFKLRWLRSVSGSHENQSISSTEVDSSLTIIVATTRVWTVQRNGGLDLELNDFQTSDAGNYSCQAISPVSETILSESQVQLTVSDQADDNKNSYENSLDAINVYSQSTLLKLLPSLKVLPKFTEISLGETVQLVCLTSGLDPDPEPSEIKWSFEPASRWQLTYKAPITSSQLPPNISVIGNVLVVWSMSEEHSGFYRCLYTLDQFNLSVEAVGELAIRPASDSAPLVFVMPELVRLLPNGSATIQCEVTGYPPPTLSWYRVDVPSSDKLDSHSIGNNETHEQGLDIDGVEIESIRYEDALAHCELNKCILTNSSRYGQISGVSIVHLSEARAHHQGQYVCRASNQHGSNQASSVVDVEFSEPPVVTIADEFKEQTIELTGNTSQPLNVTFKCSIVSGQPKPRLRWLRMANNKLANKDYHDLSRVSSATSNVSTRFEDGGRVLLLVVSTVSFDDEGDYVCLAENQWGRHSAVARLLIRKQVSVRISQPSPVLARINESFHLDCLATGHPVPLDIEWSRSDKGAFFSLITRSSTIQGVQERAMLKFDRVGPEESGEYTCSARDPLNSQAVLRDTIMVLVDDAKTTWDNSSTKSQDGLLPRLMVRPAKTSAQVGSNLTLDCLAVSGLQPTLVEWIPPHNDGAIVRPYYRADSTMGQIFQFGSRLKILNVSKAHEGIYQCKGSNKIGTENAPALVKVFDNQEHLKAQNRTVVNGSQQTLTKVAKFGSNIELKCQVNGIEQPATSWSRDGLELPKSSVQIEHNLWIQNVSSDDNGLYICSARAKQPNKVIQAKINLLVQSARESPEGIQNLSAKIVASKSMVNLGDSITLECIVSGGDENATRALDLDELERNVIWTNLHSGQTLFQDNVYIQNNLLIIYDLKSENSATYRCNYNDLTQFTDYTLQLNNESFDDFGSKSSEREAAHAGNHSLSSTGRRVDIKQVFLGSHLILECPDSGPTTPDYYWTRGSLSGNQQRIGSSSKPLVLENIKTEQADIYNCHLGKHREPLSVLVSVHVPVARFTQKPVSFISLPTISGANHQLEIEMKFLPERDSGLLLFNGQHSLSGDYMTLGLNKGLLEFRFELGDGLTILKSLQPVSLNQWHKVVIERNRRRAVMWLDAQLPISNNSAGKFFILNLDSVLYVGGNQYFLNNNLSRSTNSSSFYGYSQGFQGCISTLKISRNYINLMARNRSVSVGVYECDKSECKLNNCNQQTSVCQVDPGILSEPKNIDPMRRASVSTDLRCICLPGFGDSRCDKNITSVIKPLRISPNVSLSKTVCSVQNSCSIDGTIQCQSLTSTSYKCHCRLGFMGENCSQTTQFPRDTSVWFNQNAYLQFRFNKPDETQALLQKNQVSHTAAWNASQLSLNDYAKLSSMEDNQNISFDIRTSSSYGLIFYTGLVMDGSDTRVNLSQAQTSKSMVANYLSRLSSVVFDYLAIALVDGHVELSYELGSGVAVIRSSQRINDGLKHHIEVLRNGKLAKLTIDEMHEHKGTSPGNLSKLNSQSDIYLGSFLHMSESTNSMYMSGFVGCISELKINTLGPLSLIQSNFLTQVESARNLVPCPPTNQKATSYQGPSLATGEDQDET